MVGVEIAGGRIIHENVRKLFASVEDLLCFGEDGNGNERPVGRAFRFHHSGTGEHEMNPLTLVWKCHFYTKTEHRPYDLAVMACLIIAKHYLGKEIVVYSDGSEEKWEPARRLCENYFGYGGGFRLDNV